MRSSPSDALPTQQDRTEVVSVRLRHELTEMGPRRVPTTGVVVLAAYTFECSRLIDGHRARTILILVVRILHSCAQSREAVRLPGPHGRFGLRRGQIMHRDFRCWEVRQDHIGYAKYAGTQEGEGEEGTEGKSGVLSAVTDWVDSKMNCVLVLCHPSVRLVPLPRPGYALSRSTSLTATTIVVSPIHSTGVIMPSRKQRMAARTAA